jgi:DnaJ-class molecular chaperone
MQRSSGGRGGGGRGGFEDVLRDMFGGLGGAARARRGGGGQQFEEEEYAPPPGRDVTANTTITLEEAAKGTTRRVQLPTGKELEVKVPAGLTDGQQIRLKGQGLAAGGKAGDVLITVSIAPHHLFERDGNDLRIELPVTLYEAVLGAKVRVPTLDGAVELAIPPNTSSGRTMRVKGKGLPSKDGTGDLYATVRIVLPDQPDAAELAAASNIAARLGFETSAMDIPVPIVRLPAFAPGASASPRRRSDETERSGGGKAATTGRQNKPRHLSV